MLAPGFTGSKQDFAPEIQVLSRGSALIQMTLTMASPQLSFQSSVSAVVSQKQDRSSGKLAEGKSLSTNFLNFIDQIINKYIPILKTRYSIKADPPSFFFLKYNSAEKMQNKYKMMERGQNTPGFYIYQMRRPRPSNPTYDSNSVNATCFSIYHGGPLDHAYTGPVSQSQINHELKQEFSRSRGMSQLSNIGSSLLKLEDRDIYNTQKSKYDIITMGPTHQDETIKKYPKFTLEDKDTNYLKRMGKLIKNQQEEKSSKITQQVKPSKESTAGRYTYSMDNKKTALDLWQSYQGKPPIQPHFTAKMLNHADEFRSLI